MANNQAAHVVTGTARLSYVHLFTPYASPDGGGEKYSVTVLVPKNDVATRARIDGAIEAAKTLGATKCWGGVRPPVVAVPIYDGDGVRPSDGMPFGEECRGHWVFTASSKHAPGVVDANVNPIINQSEIYSGIYGRVSIDFYPYVNSGKKGVGCGLGNVQKISDGEPLGSKTNPQDDFATPISQFVGQGQTYQQNPYNGTQGQQYTPISNNGWQGQMYQQNPNNGTQGQQYAPISNNGWQGQTYQQNSNNANIIQQQNYAYDPLIAQLPY